MINTIHTYKFNYKNTTNKFQFNIFSKITLLKAKYAEILSYPRHQKIHTNHE